MTEKYKIANNKLKALKKDIASIANDLKAYEDQSVVETKITMLENEIKNADKILEENLPIKGSLEAENANIQKEIDGYVGGMDALLTRETEKKNDIATYTAIRDSLINDIDVANADTEKENLQKEISELSGDIRVNDTNKAAKNGLIVDYQNRITAKTLEMASYGKKEDIDALKDKIANREKEMAEKKDLISKNEFSPLLNKMMEEKKSGTRFLDKFTEFTKFIEKYFSDLSKHSISASKSNIEFFLEEDCEESFNRQIKQSRNTIEGKRNLLTEQEREKSGIESHRCQYELLQKRPAECSIDSCPFIADALKWRNIESMISESEAAIAQSKIDLEKLDTKADNLNELFNLFKLFNVAYTNVSPRENSILAAFLSEKSLKDWINSPLSEFQYRRQEYISKISELIETIDSFLALRQSNIADKALLESQDNNLNENKDKTQKEIDEYTEKKTIVEKDYDDLIKKGQDLSNKLTEKQALFKKYSDYLIAKSKIDSATVMLSTTQSDIKHLNELINKQNEITSQYNQVNQKIIDAQNSKSGKSADYNAALTSLGQIKQLNSKLENLNKVYKPTETVVNALSPTSGIPLILIQLYLGETERIANELLDSAFGGDFKIKFITTDKDFSIQVQAKNNIKDDIALASQGEVALTTISISLALIEQSIGDYNILCLDEIDGPLDANNRENFINILNSQINKLGIEQVCVISHNNAFDTCPLDLVLLKNNGIDTKKNSGFMDNKTVIFNYEED